ncbi:MAG: alpha/beta hydrolase [Actinomycetota bacterium]
MTAFDFDDVTVLTSDDGEPVALHDLGGPADGPPLLLSHGNGLNVGMWAAAIPDLAERFRCYGVDLRGHGRSRPTGTGYPVGRERFAADLITAIDAIGGPVCFAGHSLGAASAVQACLLDGTNAARLFTGLWLFEPVLVPDGFERGEGPSFLIEMSRKRRMEFDSVDDAIERFGSKPPFAGCDPASVRGYVEVGTVPTESGVRLSCEGEDEARVFETMATLDFTRLASVGLPTMVVSGAAADVANALPPKLAPLVADAMGPSARWVEFDGLSHFGPMEAPGLIARSITGFFDEVITADN